MATQVQKINKPKGIKKYLTLVFEYADFDGNIGSNSPNTPENSQYDHETAFLEHICKAIRKYNIDGRVGGYSKFNLFGVYRDDCEGDNETSIENNNNTNNELKHNINK